MTTFKESSEPFSSNSEHCISLSAHPATVLFTKKQPDLIVNPIKVTTITAYCLLYNITNTIMFHVAFLLCLSENPVPHSKIRPLDPEKPHPRKAEEQQFTKSFVVTINTKLIHDNIFCNELQMTWLLLKQCASQFELERAKEKATYHAWTDAINK